MNPTTVREVLRLLRMWAPIDYARHGAVAIQDFGIIDPTVLFPDLFTLGSEIKLACLIPLSAPEGEKIWTPSPLTNRMIELSLQRGLSREAFVIAAHCTRMAAILCLLGYMGIAVRVPIPGGAPKPTSPGDGEQPSGPLGMGS